MVRRMSLPICSTGPQNTIKSSFSSNINQIITLVRCTRSHRCFYRFSLRQYYYNFIISRQRILMPTVINISPEHDEICGKVLKVFSSLRIIQSIGFIWLRLRSMMLSDCVYFIHTLLGSVYRFCIFPIFALTWDGIISLWIPIWTPVDEV